MRDAQESLARLVACSSLWMMSAVAFFSVRSGDVAPRNIGLLPILPPVEAEASINEVISVSKHCRQKSDSTLQSRAQGMCRERNQCVTDCRGAMCSLYLRAAPNGRVKVKAVHPALVGFGYPPRSTHHPERVFTSEMSIPSASIQEPAAALQCSVSPRFTCLPHRLADLGHFELQRSDRPALFSHSRAAIHGQLTTRPASSGSRCACVTRAATVKRSLQSSVCWCFGFSVSFSVCTAFSFPHASDAFMHSKIQFEMLARTVCVYGKGVGQVAALRSKRRHCPIFEIENVRS